MEKRRVLITGLGTVNPLGHNAADTWQAVRDGVCGIGPITRYDCSAQKVHLAAEVKDWDPTTVLDKKDVRHMSRYTQLAAAAAKEALADSGLDREKEDLTRCGVIVSSGVGGIEMAESEELRCSQKGFDRASPFYIAENLLLGLGVNPDPFLCFIFNPGHLRHQAVNVLTLPPGVGTDIDCIHIFPVQKPANDFKLLFNALNHLIFKFFRKKRKCLETPPLIFYVVCLRITHGNEMSHTPGYDCILRFNIAVRRPARNLKGCGKFSGHTRFFCYV